MTEIHYESWVGPDGKVINTKDSGWIGVDLDGTLAHYDGYKGPYTLGEPVPLMVERVKKWIADGIEVRVFTARANDLEIGDDMEKIISTIEDWTEKHIGKRLKVTNIKDQRMLQLWDDRAIRVEKNTGKILGDE